MLSVNNYLQIFNPTDINLYLAGLSSTKNITPMIGRITKAFLLKRYPESDVEDYYDVLSKKISVDTYEEAIDGITSEWQSLLDEKQIKLSDKNIQKGFEKGIIDLKGMAIFRGESYWADQNGDFFIDANASLKEMIGKISQSYSVIPCFDKIDLNRFLNEGVIEHGGSIIASRSELGGWMIAGPRPRSVSFDEYSPLESIIRVLHHSDTQCYIQKGDNLTWFHGTTSRTEDPDMLAGAPKNYSMQGKALYCTSSLDEAISVYANQFNPEVMSKRNIETNGHEGYYNLTDKHSFVYKVTVEKGNFHYSNSDMPDRIRDRLDPFEQSAYKTLGIMDVPSPHLMKIVAQKNGVSPRMLALTMNRLYKSSSSDDVFLAINEMAITEDNASHQRNVLQMIAPAMGFSGFAARFPNKETMQQISSLRDNSDFLGLFKGHKSVSDMIDAYAERLRNSVPRRAQKDHLLCFDDSFEVVAVKKLPFHNRIITNDHSNFNSNDDFYGRNSHDFDAMVVSSVNEKEGCDSACLSL